MLQSRTWHRNQILCPVCENVVLNFDGRSVDHEPLDSELLAYLDESLSVARSAEIEEQLRKNGSLRLRLTDLLRNRDQGGHTVGEIWRRERLSCLTRTQLGSYVLKVLPKELTDYIGFHLNVIGCRFCLANLEDLTQSQQFSASQQDRQKRYFESSAGILRLQEKEKE